MKHTKAVISRSSEYGLYTIRIYHDEDLRGVEVVEDIDISKIGGDYVAGYRDGIKATIDLLEKERERWK